MYQKKLYVKIAVFEIFYRQYLIQMHTPKKLSTEHTPEPSNKAHGLSNLGYAPAVLTNHCITNIWFY